MDIESLRKMLDTPRDSAMLRLTLAGALAQQGDRDSLQEACQQLESALEMDPAYTAAWKELGKACLKSEDSEAAARAWTEGVRVARNNGDIQAEKEMTVFLRRLQRKS